MRQFDTPRYCLLVREAVEDTEQQSRVAQHLLILANLPWETSFYLTLTPCPEAMAGTVVLQGLSNVDVVQKGPQDGN